MTPTRDMDPWADVVPVQATLRRPLIAAAIFTGVVLVAFAILRERADFWLNAGGYPLWLRSCVACFVPLFATQCLLLIGLAVSVFAFPNPSLVAWWFEAAWISLATLLTVTAAVAALADNVSNLIDGRPWHDHAVLPSRPRTQGAAFTRPPNMQATTRT